MGLSPGEFAEIHSGNKVGFRYLGKEQVGWVQGWRTWPIETTVIIQPDDQSIGEDRNIFIPDTSYFWTHFAGAKNIVCVPLSNLWLLSDEWTKVIPKYPHKCPRCQRKALILDISVECSNYDCYNYKWIPTFT